jgi:hypothetical protein
LLKKEQSEATSTIRQSSIVNRHSMKFHTSVSEIYELHILGTDVAHLISTIDHNLKSDPIGPLFQRKVAYDNLPDEVIPEFRKYSAKRAQTLLESLDRWLGQRDRDVTPTVKGGGRNRAGLWVYYFEEPYSNGEN